MVQGVIFLTALAGIFFADKEINATTANSRPVKEIAVKKSGNDGDLYQSKQTETINIEYINGHFLLRDLDSERQYTLAKDKVVNLKNRQMQSYVDENDPDISLMFDKKNKEVIYNNNTFKKTGGHGEILNVQTAIDKVQKEKKLQKNIIVSGSNARDSDEDGRLYYKIKVSDRQHKSTKIYQVYSDDGKIESFANHK
ncbi:hypothetical protein [Ligilactobacillus pobuzihii]|uniref:hypothetical protein n=1 Tax=Ligilactobacillus pobuzihii TaxID=449659 RepID=UPI0019D0BAF3|nr:hypothetical protein [Ligilactobacillus pobuzihii]